MYALPTAQQASRVRARHPEADVDTCSGAFFLYKAAVEVMDYLTSYDMVAVDEISQLSQSDFERSIQMWEAADKVPALVLAGDFRQLPGVDPSKATDSPRWSMVYQVNLAIWVLFTTRKKRALAELPVDWEANPDNYDQDNAINTFKYVMCDGLRCFFKPAGSVGVSSLCCKCVCY